MAKRVFTSANLTYTAAAAGSAIGLGSTYMALKGGSGTQQIDILEVLISGKATASTVAAMELDRVSTLETTLTTLTAPQSDGPMNPATAALAAAPSPFVTAAAQPTPSNIVTDARLNLGLNLFGGIIRWNAAPTQQFTMLGNTASFGETILWNSSTAGGSSGNADAHWIYEPY